jgi:hypothetical protein
VIRECLKARRASTRAIVLPVFQLGKGSLVAAKQRCSLAKRWTAANATLTAFLQPDPRQRTLCLNPGGGRESGDRRHLIASCAGCASLKRTVDPNQWLRLAGPHAAAGAFWHFPLTGRPPSLAARRGCRRLMAPSFRVPRNGNYTREDRDVLLYAGPANIRKARYVQTIGR